MNGSSKKRKKNVPDNIGRKIKKPKVTSTAVVPVDTASASVKTKLTSCHTSVTSLDSFKCRSGNKSSNGIKRTLSVSSNCKSAADNQKCAKIDSNLENKGVAAVVSRTTGSNNNNQSIITKKTKGVSSNWKNLLKSGKVLYTKKPSTDNVAPPVIKPSEIWFDDVDEVLLDLPQQASTNPIGSGESLVKANSFEGVTKIIGMDCEMVGVGEGGKDSVLARVSIVNHFGHCIYDTFVKPTEKVTDYRTHVSGIRPSNLVNAENFKTVQQKVADLLKDRILVGHALHNDMKVLFLSHPRKDIRDTAQYKPFRELVHSGRPSLKKLTAQLLGVEVQQGEHNSIQDAQAAIRLYTLHRKEWEKSIKMRRFQSKSESSKATNSRYKKKKKLKNSSILA